MVGLARVAWDIFMLNVHICLSLKKAKCLLVSKKYHRSSDVATVEHVFENLDLDSNSKY